MRHLSALLPLIVVLSACGPYEEPLRALSVESVTDLGALSLPATSPGRDGGWSGEAFGRLLWTFGDTFVTVKTEDNMNIRSSTAAWSPKGGAFSTTLTEPLTAQGIPFQLVPYSAAENVDNAADAQNGWALWGGPVLFQRGSEAFFLYSRIRREGGSGFRGAGNGIARLRDGETQATRDPGLLFGETEASFGNGAAFVADGFVYLYHCEVTGFLNMTCRVARAPVASAETRSSYRFFDGAQWNLDITQAATVVERAASGFSVTWNDHLGSYLAVQSELLGNRIGLRTAPAPEGPWSAAVWIAADGVGILPAGAGTTNYLAVQHPGLEREGGREITIGYSRPTSLFHGDVRLARVRLGE